MSATEIVSSVLLLIAVAFVLLASVGLHRFDDVFSRIHAATKAITLGVVLAAGAATLQMDRTTDVAKLVLAVVLQLVSAPVSAHMVGRAAYWSGTDLSPDTGIDELADSTIRRPDSTIARPDSTI